MQRFTNNIKWIIIFTAASGATSVKPITQWNWSRIALHCITCTWSKQIALCQSVWIKNENNDYNIQSDFWMMLQSKHWSQLKMYWNIFEHDSRCYQCRDMCWYLSIHHLKSLHDLEESRQGMDWRWVEAFRRRSPCSVPGHRVVPATRRLNESGRPPSQPPRTWLVPVDSYSCLCTCPALPS